MKRKAVITAGLIFIMAASGVCAAVYNSEYNVESYDLTQNVKLPDIKNTDKLKLVAEKIKSNTSDEEEAYMITLNYVYALEKNGASDYEQDYLHNLILNEADADMIRKIYTFLQDTDYSVEMVEKMYKIAVNICEDDEFWVETAFNKATDNVHGVLNKEQVTDYLNQGLTAEDINTANILCRKGVFTINEILDKRIGGTEWSDIFDEVYSDITEPDTVFNVRSFKKADKIVGKQIPSDMITAMRLSKMVSQKPERFLVDKNESVDNYKKRITSDYIDKSEEILNSIDLKTPKQKRENADEKTLDVAREHGLSEKQIEKYFEEGFSDTDIRNASVIAKDKSGVDTILKKRKDGKSINEIINEEVGRK